MADKIVAEYTVKVDKALKDLEKLAKKVDKVDDERKKTQDGFKSMSSDMVSGFKKVGVALGVAFGAQEIVSFGKEAIKLASQLEGVERAFKRIGGANSANLLQGLRTATRGTVSDLVLMQKAVQASNFKIPLENLASLFKFAQARARETGESVEYLTNSIVLGIGRKSPLILDNLGISAVELRTRLKGVGVEAANVGDIAQIIGDIAEEELAKMGDQADTTADKIAQLNTALENTKTKIGTTLINEITKFTDELSGTEEEISKLGVGFEEFDSISFFTKNAINALLEPFEKLNELVNQGARYANIGKKALQDFADEAVIAAHKMTLNNDELIEFLKLSDSAQVKLARLSLGLDEYGDVTADAERATELFNKQFLKIDESIGEESGVVLNIKLLNDQLKDLKTQLSEAAIGGSEFFDLTEKIADKTKELNEAIAQTKLQDAFIIDQEPFEEINTNLDNYVEETENATTAATDAWEAHFNELMAAQDEAFKKKKDKDEEYALYQAEQVALYEETFYVVADIAARLGELSAQKGRQELANLQERLEAGLISEEEFSVKKRQILSQEAEDQKGYAIFQATINTAQAVVAALGSQPFTPANIALAAAVGVAGAVQIGLIASQPTPTFAEGGWVDGKGLIHGRSHARGGVKIEAEGNEYITKGKYAKPNAEILEAINTGNWERYKMENIITPAINQVLEGGFGGMAGSAMLNSSFNDRNLLTAFDRNRKSERQSAMFIVSELSRSLKGRKRGGYA